MNTRIFALFLILGTLTVTNVAAARAPEVFLNTTIGSSMVQISIIDTDANTPVLLYYQAGGTKHSLSIGTTNSNGNLSTTVDSSKYGITSGSQAYVSANGAVSPSVAWPDYTNGGFLPLSVTTLRLLPGQSTTVTASVSADLTLGSNSAPGVASATISGRQILVKALATGTDNISICAVGLGCSTIAVTVTSNNGSNISQAAFSLSTETGNGSQIKLELGQVLSVPLLGIASHIFSVSSNSSPTVIDASASGTNVYLTGLAFGGANIQVCEFQGQCATIYVYVQQKVSTPAPVPTPAPSSPVTPVASRAVFTTYLKPGSNGTEVRALQGVLIKLGLLKHVATGFYGSLTVDAVAALQKKNNLAALGVVGPATRSLLNSLAQ